MRTYDILPTQATFPGEVITGFDQAEQLAAKARQFGNRGLLVHGQSMRRRGKVSKITANTPTGMELETWEYSGGEPTRTQLLALINAIRTSNVDWVAGLGGGSILDLTKAAALHAPQHSIAQLFDAEIPATAASMPFIAIPTTAGTGAEATTVAVITDPETGIKQSLRSPRMMARLVILDPALLKSLPPHVIAHAGMDALTQAIESYVSNKATWFSRKLALKATAMLYENLPALFENGGTDRIAARNMLQGSFLAGVAFSSSGLGAVHGLAGPLGGSYGIPHGHACAACLPYVLNYNRTQMAHDYKTLSTLVGQDLLVGIAALLARLGLQNPFKGRTLNDLDTIVQAVLSSASTQCNPREMNETDARALVRELFTY
jgi:alcohol dehydrogenase class IV